MCEGSKFCGVVGESEEEGEFLEIAGFVFCWSCFDRERGGVAYVVLCGVGVSSPLGVAEEDGEIVLFVFLAWKNEEVCKG